MLLCKIFPWTSNTCQWLLVVPISFSDYLWPNQLHYCHPPLRSRDAQSVAKALIYRVIYLFRPPRQITCDKAVKFTSHIVQAILHMLDCKLKVISPYNHGSSKVERQIKTVSDIIVNHLWDKGQMWPLFATTAAYAMNTFASETLNGFSSFQLVFVCDLPDLTSLSFPKIDTILVAYREYYNLFLARAQMVSRLLLEWRTQQALEFENRNRQFTKEEILKMIKWYICWHHIHQHCKWAQQNLEKISLDWPIIHRYHPQ